MNKDTKNTSGSGAGIGLGIAALAAVAAGAYFLYGKGGDKRRAKVQSWMLKMRGDVLEKVEELKDVSKETYDQVIDEVKARYEGMKNVDMDELKDLTQELKGHWKNIKKQIEPVRKAVKKKK